MPIGGAGSLKRDSNISAIAALGARIGPIMLLEFAERNLVDQGRGYEQDPVRPFPSSWPVGNRPERLGKGEMPGFRGAIGHDLRPSRATE